MDRARDRYAASLTSYRKDGQYVSFYGDNHPRYAGNVVKAMASAKHGYPQRRRRCSSARSARHDPARQPERDATLGALFAKLDDLLRRDRRRGQPPDADDRRGRRARAAGGAAASSRASSIACRTSRAARRASTARVLAMEGLALTGAWVDKEHGPALADRARDGQRRRGCARRCKPGEPVVVMGPTGTPTEIPQGETVLLAGGGLGNAVLFSIGKALRAAGNRGHLLRRLPQRRRPLQGRRDRGGGRRGRLGRRSRARSEAAAASRPQDLQLRRQHRAGDESLRRRASSGRSRSRCSEVDHLIAIGSDRMMAAVKEARHGVLAAVLEARARRRSARSTRRCNA